MSKRLIGARQIMLFRRESTEQTHCPRQATIDEVAAQENRTHSLEARAKAEAKRRIDLALRLGERAMNGEPIGIIGFLAIGYPDLAPEDPNYQKILSAYMHAKAIPAGKVVRIGDDERMIGRDRGVVGIKADNEDDGVSFSVTQYGDGFAAQANLVFTKALYMTDINTAETAIMHGTEGDDDGDAWFIDSSLSNGRGIGVFSVRVVLPRAETLDPYDRFENGDVAWTGDYTDRLLAR